MVKLILLAGVLVLASAGCSGRAGLTTEEVIASCNETDRLDSEFESAHDVSDPETFEEPFDAAEVVALVESLVSTNRAVANWEHTSQGEILVEMADYQQGLADEVAKAGELTLVELGEIASEYGDPDLDAFSELESDPSLVFDPEFVSELADSSCAATVQSVSDMNSLVGDS